MLEKNSVKCCGNNNPTSSLPDPNRCDDEENLLGREGKLHDGLSKVHDFLGIGVNSDSSSHGTWRAILAASTLM